MVAGCGNKCIKYVFWIINFLFFVLGGLVCGLALWIRFDNAFKQKIEGILRVDISRFPIENFYSLLYVIAAFGLFLFILGFFGCCGSCTENLCVIGIYFACVLILFVAELAGGIYLGVNKDNVRNQIAQVWRNELVNNYNNNQMVHESLDNVQRQLQCCGAQGCADFAAAPSSCPAGCFSIGSPQYANVPGCSNLMFDTLTGNLTTVIIVAVAILVVELIAMIFACIVCNAVKERRNMNF